MALLSGPLDRRITLQRQVSTRNEKNQPVTSYIDVRTVWASWRRATANERLASGQVTAQVTDIFEIRYSATVAVMDPKGRVLFDDQVYDLVEVTQIGRREGLLLRASAIVDGAGA